MISRLAQIIGLLAALLGTVILAPQVPAQGRGHSGGPNAGSGARIPFAGRGRNGFGRRNRGDYLNDSGYFFSPYLYSDFYPGDELDYGPPAPQTPPVQVVVAQSTSAVSPARAAESLLLENRDGLWVRIATGNQTAVAQSAQADSERAPRAKQGITEVAPSGPASPELPPAILVFRDGHTEEVGKYVIQGDAIYVTANYWDTGSWSKKIPLSDVDVSATLKLNKDRGTKFNLPSGPSEVVVRF